MNKNESEQRFLISADSNPQLGDDLKKSEQLFQSLKLENLDILQNLNKSLLNYSEGKHVEKLGEMNSLLKSCLALMSRKEEEKLKKQKSLMIKKYIDVENEVR